MCGRLDFSLYGTRRAASNWQKCYTDMLVKLGFEVGVANATTFVHKQRGIHCMVHGDDFVSTGKLSDLQWMKEGIANTFIIKTNIMGPRVSENEIKIFKRIIRYTSEGIEVEADVRHSELIVKQLGLSDAKGLSMPMVSEAQVNREDSKELDGKYSTQFRSIVARGNYLA